MITTISKICDAKGISESQILLVKQELMLLKKRGTIFFTNDLSSLGIEDPFSIYYCIQTSESSVHNAFPIPICYYYDYIAQSNKFDFLKSFFQSYYGEKTFTNELFSLYSNHKVFLADDYAWFYYQVNDIA